MPNFWKIRPQVLLTPNVPQPMHGVAPRVILGSSWWNKTRKVAYDSTNQRCIACGIHKTKAKMRQWLEGHELYDIDYKLGRVVYLETVPLCHPCHNFIHDGRCIALLEKGEMSHWKYSAIMSHGQSVLRKAGIIKPTLNERIEDINSLILSGNCALWEEWKLVLFDKEYPSLHTTVEAYNNHWEINDNSFSWNPSKRNR